MSEEAFLSGWRGRLLVVKIGGTILGSGDTTLEDLVTLQGAGARPVVVHGGGRLITEWLQRQRIRTTFVRGLRFTDAAALEVVVAVLAGLVNKRVVATLQRLGGRAVGVSGIDGALFQATIKNPDLGLVGEVTHIHAEPIQTLLDQGYLPVVAPLACNTVPDGQHPVLNVNADHAAGELARALQAAALFFLTDVDAVYDGQRRALPRLHPPQVRELVEGGAASGGMIPKLEAAVRALATVQRVSILDGRRPRALRDALAGGAGGTAIEP